MKSILLIKLALLSLIFISTVAPTVPTGSSTLGVFVGSSACDVVSKPSLQIPAAANSEPIKWSLTLCQDTNALILTTCKFNYVYGVPERGTNGLSEGGTRVG